jgi:SAM-dependent methyltransferase
MSLWDNRYNSSEYIFGTEPNDFLRDRVGEIPSGGRVLCIGDGEGRNAVFLAGLGFQVTAMDASAVGMQKAQELAQRMNVQIQTVVGDLAEFAFGTQCWDGFVSIFCHLPPVLRSAVHAQVLSALAPKGVFLLEGYAPSQLQYKTGGPSDPAMLYELDAVSQELAGLDVVVLEEVIREIQEGTAHRGTSATVQYIGRKA